MAESGVVAGAVAVVVVVGMAVEIAADLVVGAAEDAAGGLVEGGGIFTMEKVRI